MHLHPKGEIIFTPFTPKTLNRSGYDQVYMRRVKGVRMFHPKGVQVCNYGV